VSTFSKTVIFQEKRRNPDFRVYLKLFWTIFWHTIITGTGK
jgi:hypothetical protein